MRCILVLSSEKNLYEILEVTPDASEAAIKTAYRKLARKYHPDLNQGDAACSKRFKEVTEAYEVLSNSDKKKNYDILKGIYRDEYKAKRSQAAKAYKDIQREEKMKNAQFTNVFNDILEGFKTTTSSSKKDFEPKPPRPERGSDVYADVTITMHQALMGTARTINILHTEKCPNCEGRKFINGTKCPLCKGKGEQSIHKKLSVKIPSGVKHGSKIRIPNEGNKGYNGGKNGDLYLNIKIETTNIFKYDGLNILCTIPITPFEAVLGATINIPTPEGNISMKILPNTNSGQKFRLSGQGLKGQNKQVGDMIVTVNIEIPKEHSKKELDLYEELKSINKTDIRKNLFNGI